MLLVVLATGLSTATSMKLENSSQPTKSLFTPIPTLQPIRTVAQAPTGAAQAGRALPTSGGIATGRPLLPPLRLPAGRLPQGDGGGQRGQFMSHHHDQLRTLSILELRHLSLPPHLQLELARMVSRDSTRAPPPGCLLQPLLVAAHPHQPVRPHASKERSQTGVSTNRQGAVGEGEGKYRGIWESSQSNQALTALHHPPRLARPTPARRMWRERMSPSRLLPRSPQLWVGSRLRLPSLTTSPSAQVTQQLTLTSSGTLSSSMIFLDTSPHQTSWQLSQLPHQSKSKVI